MSDFLSAETSRRVETIRQHVRDMWATNSGPPWYTFHNDSHNLAIENMLYKLIPREKRKALTDDEWFLLLASAWLHDMGMMLAPGEGSESVNDVRALHHERSAKYIMANRNAMGIKHHDANLIAEICRYHRKSLNIYECEAMVGNIRLRMLAAYLRLADALHTDVTRTSEAMYQLLVTAGMPWDSRIHWLKSFWVASIIPDFENLSIRIDLIDTHPKSSRMELLAQLVGNEVQEELDSVRDVLIRSGVTFFLDVYTKVVELDLDESYPIELDLVLSNLEQENLSSASEVADSIINTIIRLTQFGHPAYKMIREYRAQLDIVLKHRSCHVLIRHLLDKISTATQQDNLAEDTSQRIVEQIRADLISFKEIRLRDLAALAENARPFLSDGGSILLFGYSSLVIEALKCLTPQVKERVKIYILEGRGKTQYNHKNELIYCDGIRYAVDVRKAGFTNVVIVPDICAANLMFRGLIGKVVFGANGIDPSGAFGHSAGHLAVADSARQYKVPVYVIADSAKFGKFPWNKELEREHKWLTRDPKPLKLLNDYNIKLLNPREDRVDRECVDMLITEIGAFPPTRIPESLRR